MRAESSKPNYRSPEPNQQEGPGERGRVLDSVGLNAGKTERNRRAQLFAIVGGLRKPKRNSDPAVLLDEIASLNGMQLWDRKLEFRLSSRASYAKGMSVPSDFDPHSAIQTRRRESVKIEATEFLDNTRNLRNFDVHANVEEIAFTGGRNLPGVNWRSRTELQVMLEDFLYAFHEASQDGDIVSWNSWTSLLKPVEQYLGKPDIQTPETTKYMLLRLLECVLRPFRSYKAKFSFWKNPVFIAIAIVLLGVAGPHYHFLSVFWIGWFALAVWAGARVVHFVRVLGITSTGDAVQKQIESNEYTAEETIRRICQMERKKVFFPPLLYSLVARLPLKSNTGA